MRKILFLGVLGFGAVLFFALDALANSSDGSGLTCSEASGSIASRRSAARARRARLEKVCPKINTAYSRLLWKSESSGHIPGGDSRTGGCTFIYGLGSKAPGAGLSCLTVYDSKGNAVAKLGRYALNNSRAYKERYYTGTGCAPKLRCSDLARIVKRNTGNTTVYIGTGRGTCQKVPTVIGRYGGV